MLFQFIFWKNQFKTTNRKRSTLLSLSFKSTTMIYDVVVDVDVSNVNGSYPGLASIKSPSTVSVTSIQLFSFEMSKILCFLVIAAVGLLAVKADSESRTIGGQDAVRGQFPHHRSNSN